MAEGDRRFFPFLPLPAAATAERAKLRGFGTPIVHWGHDRQVARVRPQLQRLQDAFRRRSIELRDDLAGVEPELALVIETVGSVDRFRNAVAKIRGLEWLTEADEPQEAGEDFHRKGRKGEALGGSLYLVMTNRRALEELLSLWQRYERDEKAKFPAGLAPLRNAFRYVRTIRPWGPQDRLQWVLDDWRDRLEWGTPMVRAQVELWFRASEAARERQLEELAVRLRRSGGRLIGRTVVIPEIAYHACVIEVPREKAAEIVDGEEVELVRAEGVMFFRPVGQVAVPVRGEEAAAGVEGAPAAPAAELEPVVTVLDGLPLEGHDLLRGRLRIDDPDGWAEDTPVEARHHGTAMASLVVHGDLSQTGGQEPLARPVYLRPLLRAVDAGPLGVREAIPEDVLEVDLVHRAVRRILTGEGGEAPTAPETLVVSFSIGDPSRLFDQQVSPLARLIDWLAWRHGLLFVVSAGNPDCARRLELSCSREELRQLQSVELRRHIWQVIVEQSHLRRLLSPAESINSLTIGGEHSDGAGEYDPRGRLDPYGNDQAVRLPSPVTALGGGVGRSLKPDLHYPAGRQLYREGYSGSEAGVVLDMVRSLAIPPGHRAAVPGVQPGRTDQTQYLCGTSNAAALTSRAAAQLVERLPELFGGEPPMPLPERRYLVPLLKALLVHDASWGASQDVVRALTAADPSSNPDRMDLGRFLGYGFPEGNRVLGCHEQRATLCGWSELGDDEGHVYRIPLPQSLVAKRVWRRLTVTLAWLSPINPFDRRYRRAHLWFEPKAAIGRQGTSQVLAVERREADNRAATRGTVQHEIFEGDRATVFTEEDEIVIMVSCRAHAGDLDADSVPYALVVSLEVAPEVDVPIYEEMRVRLRPRAQVRP